ncbi:multiple coagulation factor deficiency protein 2 [Galendromus occidentalis]|uniref:Multiple coagulation factor deficiency protein 2 n=1 Tax=Galendromus occidentalis TaxID=34638 RepID=A0AAJ6QLV0_9ACAR|nr:multiple coagulation factor deficiency protein 2 [Galendromus occidentalis]
MFALIRFFLCWTVVSQLTSADNNATGAPTTMSPEQIEEFKRKYSAEKLILDEHIKEDLKNLISLEGAGALTEQEAIFYALRMHDFDQNNQLDGLEILTLISHAGHVSGEKVAVAVDEFLKFDNNADGYVNYGEWIQGSKARRERTTQGGSR